MLSIAFRVTTKQPSYDTEYSVIDRLLENIKMLASNASAFSRPGSEDRTNGDMPDGNIYDPPVPGIPMRLWLAAHTSDNLVSLFVQRYLEVARTNEPEEWGDGTLWYSRSHMERIAKIVARYKLAEADALLTEYNTRPTN